MHFFTELSVDLQILPTRRIWELFVLILNNSVWQKLDTGDICNDQKSQYQMLFSSLLLFISYLHHKHMGDNSYSVNIVLDFHMLLLIIQ